jgi:ABC-type branched-subunit amino acid transport system ATPase component
VAEAVTRSFGGIRALAGASIEVRPGEIVGLIGPNGAGKTTLLNVLSGTLSGDGGSVRLGDLEITDLPPDMRAQLGLSRSFQDARLFAGLTVRETLQLAVGKQRSAGILASASSAPWVRSAERDTRRTADAIIERLGLAAYADTLTSSLSTGTRRICDLAAQVAAQPSVVLLDEPTAGVAQREAEAFGPLLRRIRDELDCSILIVEHDMPLLMGLCDRVYAMESGAVIASGTPEEIRADPQVIASYLGTNEAAVGRSGRGSHTAAASNGSRTGKRKRTTAAAARTAGSA